VGFGDDPSDVRCVPVVWWLLFSVIRLTWSGCGSCKISETPCWCVLGWGRHCRLVAALCIPIATHCKYFPVQVFSYPGLVLELFACWVIGLSWHLFRFTKGLKSDRFISNQALIQRFMKHLPVIIIIISALVLSSSFF
jgi:hypothetical protein